MVKNPWFWSFNPSTSYSNWQFFSRENVIHPTTGSETKRGAESEGKVTFTNANYIHFPFSSSLFLGILHRLLLYLLSPLSSLSPTEPELLLLLLLFVDERRKGWMKRRMLMTQESDDHHSFPLLSSHRNIRVLDSPNFRRSLHSRPHISLISCFICRLA